jgi:hypothetical protein
MARELVPVDISGNPELLRIAEEVSATGEGRLLRSRGADLAALVPITQGSRRRARGTKSEADLEAFRAAAGSWSDFDTDKLVADIYESRRSSRRLVDL